MKIIVNYNELRKIVKNYVISKTIGMKVDECEYIIIRDRIDGKDRSVPTFEVEVTEKS